MNMAHKNKQKSPPSKPNQLSQAASHVAQQPQQQGMAVHHVELERHVTIFSPEVVEAYSRMVPDAPERILRQFELNNEAERRSQVDSVMLSQEAMNKQAADNKRRDWMAFSLMLAVIVASGIFALLGFPILAGGTLISLFAYVAYGFFKWRKR